MHSPDELKELVEEALEELELWPELGGQQESARYALEMGGKRIRPVISLAVGEALERRPSRCCRPRSRSSSCTTSRSSTTTCPRSTTTPSGAASRACGRRSARARRSSPGDALLAEAFRLACSYPTADVARELAEATLGMIGGQYLDTMEPGTDLETVHRLKTGCLFYASVTLALWAADLPREEQALWRDFADELGMLFQVVDDILDADGYVLERGRRGGPGPREPRRRAGARAPARDPGRHLGAGRDRQRPRRANGVDRSGVAKKRLDVLLVERGLAESRAQAQALILAGLVPGHSKAGEQVDEARRARASSAGRGSSPAAARSSTTRSTRSASIRPGATASTSAPRRAASPTSSSSAAPPA